MKKVKRIFIVVVSVIFLLLISEQLYFRYVSGGNLRFLISYMPGYNEPIASFEIYLDGEKVSEGQLTYTYTNVVLKTSLRNHTAVVKINGKASEEIKFNTFLVTYIWVDYRGEDDEKPFDISIRKHPWMRLA